MNQSLAVPAFGQGVIDPAIRPNTLSNQIEKDVGDCFIAAGPNSFSVQASIQPIGGIDFVIPGIFTQTPRTELLLVDVEVSPITLLVKSSAVWHVKKKDKVVVNGATYTICASPHADSTGVTTFELAEETHG